MKKKLLFIAALGAAIIAGTAGQASAQTALKIKKAKFIDTCRGYIQVEANDSAAAAGAFTEVAYGDGTTDTLSFSYGATWGAHNYGSPGIYSIKAVAMNSSYDRLDSVTFSQDIRGCNTLTGYLFRDDNNNCVYDYATGGEPPLTSPILIQVDSAGVPVDVIHSSFFGTYGGFIYQGKGSGVLYTFTALSVPTYMKLSCLGSVSGVSSFSTEVNTGEIGFVYRCDSGYSYDAVLHAYTCAAKGSTKVIGVLSSTSCTDKSGTLTLEIDPRYTVSASSPAGGTVSANTVTWNYTNLSVDTNLTYSVYGTASPLLSMGDVAVSKGRIGGAVLSRDRDSMNNWFTASDTVKSSFDPNEKKVSPEGNIEPGQRLTYTLSFENTGTAAAEHIYVMDTLSQWLDASSIQVEASTHRMKLYTSKDGSGNDVLKFDFPGIMLADKAHPAENTGYVTFSINTFKSVARGIDISNRAGIYFDDNDVIMTNTVINMIRTLGISDPAKAGFKVYPNPVHDVFTLTATAQQFERMAVYNTLGQLMLQQPVVGGQTIVNVSQLVPGMYFLMLDGAKGSQVIKLEKQ